MAAHRARQFSATADTTNVGRDSLDQLQDEAARLAGAYPREPVGSLIEDLAALQDDVLTLLEGKQPPEYTRSLYLFATLASGMMAKATSQCRADSVMGVHILLGPGGCEPHPPRT